MHEQTSEQRLSLSGRCNFRSELQYGHGEVLLVVREHFSRLARV